MTKLLRMLWLGMCITATACQVARPQAVLPTIPAVAVSPSSTPGPAPSVSPTLRGTPTKGGGSLVWGKVTSPALAGNLLGDPSTRPYIVYLPPGYVPGDQRYPVIYVLHGFGQFVISLTNIIPTLEAMTSDGQIGEMLVVFVDGSNALGGSFYQSSETIGDYGAYIAHDLVTEIDTHYRTLPDRAHRGITGYSMGGYGAMRLALKYPDVFGAVVAEAGLYDLEIETTYMQPRYAEKLANTNLATLPEFNGLDGHVRGVLAMAAGGAANPNKPPLFLDKPYELVQGQVQLVPEVVRRMGEGDVMRELGRYLKQPERLAGILIIHGSLDIPYEAQKLDEAMTSLDVPHVYQEHDGGHLFLPEPAFQFLWDHLGVD